MYGLFVAAASVSQYHSITASQSLESTSRCIVKFVDLRVPQGNIKYQMIAQQMNRSATHHSFVFIVYAHFAIRLLYAMRYACN